MADLFKSLQGFFGSVKTATESAVEDSDFADFATAASPAAPSHAATTTFSGAGTTSAASAFPFGGMQGRPFTKWYRVWERVTLADFYQELFIIPIIIVVVIINIIGSNANKKKAKQWAVAHFPLLESEYASVGFGGGRSRPNLDDVQSKGLAKALASSSSVPQELLREKGKNEYITYCTGRQNVAWLDVKITLYKRYNPLVWLGEMILSFLFDTFAAPAERLEATAYCFDGKEKSLLPPQSHGHASPGNKDSSYDSFVWAIVHKDKMKQLRDDRYDLSLTSTKDHPKLPAWATIMSESAQVTDVMLTSELIKAVTDAGEDLEALIVSDQPIDAPRKLNDTVPKKRVSLAMRLSDSPASAALFAYFLRMPDHLVTSAHFRTEALRKVKATREEEIKKIRKVDEDEKAEERKTAAEKLKKEERDRKLSKMSAKEQKQFLEKEKEKEYKKSMKKQSMRA